MKKTMIITIIILEIVIFTSAFLGLVAFPSDIHPINPIGDPIGLLEKTIDLNSQIWDSSTTCVIAGGLVFALPFLLLCFKKKQ